MSATPPSEPVTTVEDARRRVVAPPMPRVSALLAFATSPTLHRLLPGRHAVLLGQAHGNLVWLTRPVVRANARATMEAIVGATPRAHEARALARRHVTEKFALRMIFWQPPAVASIDERSRANLLAALATGRGVMLSACHMGPCFDIASPVLGVGRRSFQIAGSWFFDPAPPNYAGRRVAWWWQKVEKRGTFLVRANRSTPTVLALLKEGEIISLYFDVIGRHSSVLLGKPVSLAPGTAKLARKGEALILPLRARRTGARVCVDILPALDARDFEDPEHLHDELARIHSELILEFAETLEDPRRAGAWEHGAKADAWISPHPWGLPVDAAAAAAAAGEASRPGASGALGDAAAAGGD
jgi:lauroyl/myristoyl acyltransferase